MHILHRLMYMCGKTTYGNLVNDAYLRFSTRKTMEAPNRLRRQSNFSLYSLVGENRAMSSLETAMTMTMMMIAITQLCSSDDGCIASRNIMLALERGIYDARTLNDAAFKVQTDSHRCKCIRRQPTLTGCCKAAELHHKMISHHTQWRTENPKWLRSHLI